MEHGEIQHMMGLLGRIDERTLGMEKELHETAEQLKQHDNDIRALQISDATRKGEARAVGRTNGLLWGAASSAFFFALSYFTGIHKQP